MSRKNRVWTYLLFGLLALSFSNQSHAIMLEFDPSSTSVTVGNSLTVDINVSGLHDPDPDEIVSAYDLLVGFDASILSLTSVSFGTALGGISLFQNVFSPALGEVEFLETSLFSDAMLDALQGDSITLASLSFNALTEGLVELSFINHPIFGFQDIKGLNAQVIDVSTSSTEIAVTPAQTIPEPGTFILLLSGLLGLLYLQFRNRLLRKY